MEWAVLGWRDVILLLVAGAALYLVLTLLKLVQVGRRHAAHEPDQPHQEEKVDTVSPLRRRSGSDAEPVISAISPAVAVSAYEEEAAASGVSSASFATPPAPTFEWDDVKELFGDAPAQLSPAATAAPIPAPAQRSVGFGEQLADHLARTEVEIEMEHMREEMERMRKEMEDLRAARRVSPVYAEAVDLMQRGLTPQDVADQLGISLAEAELVRALSRGQQNFDEGEDHGADGYATYAGHERKAG